MKQLFATLVMLPLILLALAGWETAFSLHGMREEAQQSPGPAENLSRFREIQARNPDANVLWRDGTTRPLAEAVAAARQAQADGERRRTQRLLAHTLSISAGLAALASLGAGLVGLWGVRGAVRAGLRSRRELVAGFTRRQRRMRTALCWFVAGLPLSGALLIGFAMFDATIRRGTPDAGALAFGALYLALLIGGALASAVRSRRVWRGVFTPEPQWLLAESVLPERHPEIWAFVRDIAGRAGAKPPDNLLVGPLQAFFVTASELTLPDGQRASGYSLYISLPYLRYLSREELSCIVAHELGHYIGEDLEYSRRFLPLYHHARRQLDVLDEAGMAGIRQAVLYPAMLLARQFLDSLNEAVIFWNRKNELAADAVSAAVESPRLAASALLRVTAVEPVLEQAGNEAWAALPEETPAPEALRALSEGPDSVPAHAARLVREQGFADPLETVKLQGPPSSTHPTLSVRFEAWGVVPDAALARQAMRPEPDGLPEAFGFAARTPFSPAASRPADAPDARP